jgi:hypothetical protein
MLPYLSKFGEQCDNCDCYSADILKAGGCPRKAARDEDDAWRKAGIAVSRVGGAYRVILGFIVGVLVAVGGASLVLRWVLP